jgi:hypothetical protein
MESAFRWCLGILTITAFQMGCCRIELQGGPSHAIMKSSVAPHQDHGGEGFFAGGGCAGGDCHAAASSHSAEGCGVNGLDHLFNGSLHSHWKHKVSRCGSKIACAGACGEVYWDEHLNEPPVCDPCGPQGAWTGAASGTCRPWFSRVRDLWGYRYDSPECPGCSGCGLTGSRAWAGEGVSRSEGLEHCDHGHGTSFQPSELQPSETMVPSQRVQPSPTPAQPRVAPTPDANTRRRALPLGGSVAVSDSMAEKSRGPSYRTASKQSTASKQPSSPAPETASVSVGADGVPRQLQVQTVNGQRRLVARNQ